MLDIEGALSEVAAPALEAMLVEWAGSPAAILCNLVGVTGPMEPREITLLASVGEQVRQWPGIPIGLVSPDRALREGLTGAFAGQYLAIADTRAKVWGELSAGALTATVRTILAPTARSARAARDLVTRTCLGWGCSRQLPAATLVTSELVTNAIVHAGTDVELSVSRCENTIRIAVRDHSCALPYPRGVEAEAESGRGMQLVTGLCQSWGVQRTGAGKVVWAVLGD